MTNKEIQERLSILPTSGLVPFGVHNMDLMEFIELQAKYPRKSHPLDGRTVRHKASGTLMKITEAYDSGCSCTFMGSSNGYPDGKQIEWSNSFGWDAVELVD